jgi:hypothetical protein
MLVLDVLGFLRRKGNFLRSVFVRPHCWRDIYVLTPIQDRFFEIRKMERRWYGASR